MKLKTKYVWKVFKVTGIFSNTLVGVYTSAEQANKVAKKIGRDKSTVIRSAL